MKSVRHQKLASIDLTGKLLMESISKEYEDFIKEMVLEVSIFYSFIK